MIPDPPPGTIDPGAFARLLCEWCLDIGERDYVLVFSTPLAAPLIRAFHRELITRGAWTPGIRIGLPGLAEDFYELAGDDLLDRMPPHDLAEMERADAYLNIQAPENTRSLAGVDPDRIARSTRARAPITEVRLGKRWCGTIWPTPALAQDAGMSNDDYTAFVKRALFLDRADPVAAWRELSDRQQRVVDRLNTASTIRIEAEDTDLTFRVDGRTWINSDGRRNMPSGEVFTGPLEDTANGTIRFTVPSSPRGVRVEDVTLTFKDGKVVDARAAQGQAYLDAALASDAGARLLGEIGIGTNTGIDRATGSVLLDEKIAGTVHLALGRSYPETGGVNRSALHWDLICDLRAGGRLTADGEIVEIA